MTPVDQEFSHLPEIGQQGDCMRAVLASLLGLPRDQVPHFAQIDHEGGLDFWSHVSEFCASKGFTFATFKASSFVWSDRAVYHGISGPSPRIVGGYHIVVGCNGKIVHDPHPQRSGLAGDQSDWTFSFLLRP